MAGVCDILEEIEIAEVQRSGRQIGLTSYGALGDGGGGRSALAETRVTPAIQDSIDQMVGYCVLLAYGFMTLFALPRAL